MEEQEDSSNEFLDFVDHNKIRLSEIPDERGLKLTVLEFLKIHTLFLNVDVAIMAIAEAVFDGKSNKQAAFEKFQKGIMANRKYIDDYFIDVLKRNLDENNGTSK